MTPAHHEACSREWESRLIVSRLLLDRHGTPTAARGRSCTKDARLDTLAVQCQDQGAPRMEGGSERKVRSGTHLLSTGLSLMKNEASPRSLAGARSAGFFWRAARVLSGLSPRISLPSQVGCSESSAPPPPKAGFSMPTTVAPSSPPDNTSRNIKR